MDWMELAAFEPYLYFCPRSYAKVSALFAKLKD
jgi:hypothetical protein